MSLATTIYQKIWYHPWRYNIAVSKLHKLFGYSAQEKMQQICMQFIECGKIEGDFLEFGVFEGRGTVSAYYFAKQLKMKKMNFYAFDSFEGLPEIEGSDKEGFKEFEKGDYRCGMDRYKKNLKRAKVDMSKVKLVPGWYDKTLNEKTRKKLPLKKAAFVWIDCDLYESTVPVLKFIEPYIQEGTVIVFDDWFSFRGNPKRGEQRAWYEWLAKNKNISPVDFINFDCQRKAFILHKK